MSNDDINPSKPINWWKILIVLFLFPVFITIWIFKQPWTQKSKGVAIVALWVVLLFIGLTNRSTMVKDAAEEPAQSPDVIIASEPTTPPMLSESPTPTPTPIPQPEYDSSYGNNYVAARVSEELALKLKGFVTDIYLALSPEEITTSESEYKNSVVSIFLNVQVDNSLWNQMNESQQKDAVVAITNGVYKAIGHGFPHVTINNGIRDVAEGSYSAMGEPKVKFK